MKEIYARIGQLSEQIQTLAEKLARAHPIGTPLDSSSPVYQELMARIKEAQASFTELDKKAVQNFQAEMAALGINEEAIKKAAAEATAAAQAQAEQAAAQTQAAAAEAGGTAETVTRIDTLQFEKENLPDNAALHRAVASLLKQAQTPGQPGS